MFCPIEGLYNIEEEMMSTPSHDPEDIIMVPRFSQLGSSKSICNEEYH